MLQITATSKVYSCDAQVEESKAEAFLKSIRDFFEASQQEYRVVGNDKKAIMIYHYNGKYIGKDYLKVSIRKI